MSGHGRAIRPRRRQHVLPDCALQQGGSRGHCSARGGDQSPRKSAHPAAQPHISLRRGRAFFHRQDGARGDKRGYPDEQCGLLDAFLGGGGRRRGHLVGELGGLAQGPVSGEQGVHQVGARGEEKRGHCAHDKYCVVLLGEGVLGVPGGQNRAEQVIRVYTHRYVLFYIHTCSTEAVLFGVLILLQWVFFFFFFRSGGALFYQRLFAN